MSFGPNQSVKNATNTLAGAGNIATANSAAEIGTGNTQLNTGGSNVTTGTNFMNTMAKGNQANTAAMLQPNIDQIRAGNQEQLQALSTLSPRGGGRSGTLFGATYAPNAQIQGLFGNARNAAVTALPQIGLQQQAVGTNLIGAGNQALNTSTNAAQSGVQDQMAVQQRSDAIVSGLAKGIMGLATLPFGGGAAEGGLLGMIPIGGGSGGGGGGGGGGGWV